MTLVRPDKNAKHMFFVGLCGLPWLWIVNILYHYKAVYGPLPFTNEDETERDTDESDEGLLGGILGDNENEQEEEHVDSALVKTELTKWVIRSTIGSTLMTTAFITWILIFQLNRDRFSTKWLVMSPEDEISTGW
jgi:hypothetical protein